MYFSAKLLIEYKPIAHEDDAISIEQRIILIEALDEFDANNNAIAIGKAEEFSYEAADGGIVIVSFTGVQNLFHLIKETIGHGTEIYSETKYKSFD